MNTDGLINMLPETAKDARLNVSSVLSETGAMGLSAEQIAMITLACALAADHHKVIDAVTTAVEDVLDTTAVDAARTANSIMAMNNVYYRFVHLVEDNNYATMPAKLRMNGMKSSGVETVDFELMSMAVSAINGCGMCMKSHNQTLLKHGVSAEAIQSAVRIAAVIHSVARTIDR